MFFQVLVIGPTRVRTLHRSALAHRGVVSDDISVGGLIFLTQRAGKGSLCGLMVLNLMSWMRLDHCSIGT